MNLLTLIGAGLRQQPLIQGLNLLGLALGVALVVALTSAAQQLRSAAERDARGVDLVVGAKGSPLQLVLSSVYFVDAPAGNIPAASWPRWRAHPLVAEVLPLAMGDFVAGHRLVGTTATVADFHALSLQQGAWWQRPGEVVLGARAASDSGLAVGDEVAASHGGGDGPVHGDQRLRVTGILRESGRALDRLVFTDLRTVWWLHGDHHHAEEDAEGRHDHHGGEGHGAEGDGPGSHDPGAHGAEAHGREGHGGAGHGAEGHGAEGHGPGAHGAEAHDPEAHGREGHDRAGHGSGGHDPAVAAGSTRQGAESSARRRPPLPPGFSAEALDGREVTALLLRFASPLGHGRLAREIQAVGALQAASPASEMARLVSVFGTLLWALQGLALLVIVVAALGLFVTLYQSLEQRRYDIALLRALGASRLRVSLLLLGEATVVAVGAAVLGWLLGHLALELLAALAGSGAASPLSGRAPAVATLLVFPVALAVAWLAAALPAWRAYRMDVPAVLARHGG